MDQGCSASALLDDLTRVLVTSSKLRWEVGAHCTTFTSVPLLTFSSGLYVHNLSVRASLTFFASGFGMVYVSHIYGINARVCRPSY